jgi:hypothetical protein
VFESVYGNIVCFAPDVLVASLNPEYGICVDHVISILYLLLISFSVKLSFHYTDELHFALSIESNTMVLIFQQADLVFEL